MRISYHNRAQIASATFDLRPIYAAGFTADVDYGYVNIQTLNAYGQTLATYVYYGADEWDDGSVAGWYNDDGLVDVTFAAGTGLCVAAPDAETTITIPAPEL